MLRALERLIAAMREMTEVELQWQTQVLHGSVQLNGVLPDAVVFFLQLYNFTAHFTLRGPEQTHLHVFHSLGDSSHKHFYLTLLTQHTIL